MCSGIYFIETRTKYRIIECSKIADGDIPRGHLAPPLGRFSYQIVNGFACSSDIMNLESFILRIAANAEFEHSSSSVLHKNLNNDKILQIRS